MIEGDIMGMNKNGGRGMGTCMRLHASWKMGNKGG